MVPKEGPTRRNFLQTAGSAALVCGAGGTPTAGAQELPSLYEKGWYYSMEEMGDVYRNEYNGEKPFRVPIVREGNKLVASYTKQSFVVPERFVKELLRQISEMLHSGAATYIFRLDAYHGHLYIASEEAKLRYASFAFPQDLQREVETTLADPELRVLHHTYEHLERPQPNDPLFEKYRKRNVVGFFDGQANESLPLPEPPRNAQAEPGPHRIPNFVYTAHKDGLFSIKHPHTGEEIRIDISFEDWQWYR